MPIVAWLIIAAFFAAAGVGIVHTYNSALRNEAKANQAAEGWKASQQFWQSEQERTDKDRKDAEDIAKKSKARADKLAVDNQMYRQELDSLKARDPEARAALEMRLPDSVRLLRRTTSGCPADLNVPCPTGAVGTDAAPADGRRNGGAPGSGEQGGASSTGPVQR